MLCGRTWPGPMYQCYGTCMDLKAVPVSLLLGLCVLCVPLRTSIALGPPGKARGLGRQVGGFKMDPPSTLCATRMPICSLHCAVIVQGKYVV